MRILARLKETFVFRYPLKEVEFHKYNLEGDKYHVYPDGEWLANKGVGRVRVELENGADVDVFVTHTAADPDIK